MERNTGLFFGTFSYICTLKYYLGLVLDLLGYRLRTVYYHVEENGNTLVNSVLTVRSIDAVTSEYVAHDLLRERYRGRDVIIYCSYKPIGGDLVQEEISEY